MKLCYIAGCYSNNTYLHVEQNILDAKKAGVEAIARGYYPVIPHANTPHFEHVCIDKHPSFWYNGTMELLKRCDAIMIFGDWTTSQGTHNELEYAINHKMPTMFAHGKSMEVFEDLYGGVKI